MSKVEIVMIVQLMERHQHIVVFQIFPPNRQYKLKQYIKIVYIKTIYKNQAYNIRPLINYLSIYSYIYILHIHTRVLCNIFYELFFYFHDLYIILCILTITLYNIIRCTTFTFLKCWNPTTGDTLVFMNSTRLDMTCIFFLVNGSGFFRSRFTLPAWQISVPV